MKPRIYLFVALDVMGELEGHALAEDGCLLASANFPDVPTAQVRMGLTGRRVRAYSRHYPDGYTVEWVDDINTHPGCVEARRRNAELWQAGAEARAAEQARQMEAKRFRAVSEPEQDPDQDSTVLQPDPWPDG